MNIVAERGAKAFREGRREHSGLVSAVDHSLHEVPQLLRRELIAIDVGGQPAGAIDDDGMKGMSEQALGRQEWRPRFQ